MKRQPNILFCTHTSPDYMPPAELSSRQIVAGPNMPDKKSGMGRVMSINTAETYDVAALINRLPTDQKPDLLVVLKDSFPGHMPANLANVTCRKILYIADTHHGFMPLCQMFDYVSKEKFDRYAIAHTPHHFHWFRQLVDKPLSIQLNLSARDFGKPNFSSQRAADIYFVGQITEYHRWRKILVDRIQADNVPFKMERCAASVAATNYGRHQLCLNTSNGDWTMRVFEVLSAGGCLLTNKLSNPTGFADVFKDGEDVIIYDSEDDLIEKSRYYLAKPDVCLNIARAGHAKYKQHFNENLRKQHFLEFAFSADTDVVHMPNDELLPKRVLLYEQLQELQRAVLAKHIVLSPQLPSVCADDVSDLMMLSRSDAVVDPNQTCQVMMAGEVAALHFSTPLPNFIYVFDADNLDDATHQILAAKGYEQSQSTLFAHPGFFERQV
jgi:hypothetical protein